LRRLAAHDTDCRIVGRVLIHGLNPVSRIDWRPLYSERSTTKFNRQVTLKLLSAVQFVSLLVNVLCEPGRLGMQLADQKTLWISFYKW